MDKPEHILGETDQEIIVTDSDAAQRISIEMIRQSKRNLDIIARHLDPKIYNHPDIINAVKDLAMRSHYSEIRIIAIDPTAIKSHEHPLIGLAMRLSSFIEIRVPGPDHRKFNEALLIADKIGFIHRELAYRFDGTANFRDIPKTRQLSQRFTEIWTHALPDPHFRRLHV